MKRNEYRKEWLKFKRDKETSRIIHTFNFVEHMVKLEREACAQIAETQAPFMPSLFIAIRARNEE